MNSQHFDKESVEKIEDDVMFKEVVSNQLLNGCEVGYKDTLLYIKRLISVYSYDDSWARFKFITTPFRGRTTKGNESGNGSLLRRVNYTILAYIHFVVLKKDTFDKTKSFSLHDDDSSYHGALSLGIEDNEESYRKDTKVIKGLYKDFKKWIRCIEKNGVGINNAECEYPFDKEIRWVYTPLTVE